MSSEITIGLLKKLVSTLQPFEYPMGAMFTASQLKEIEQAVKYGALDAFDNTSARVISIATPVGVLFLPSGGSFTPYFVDLKRELCVTFPSHVYDSAPDVEKHLMEKFLRDEFDDAVCKYNAVTWNRTVYINTFVNHVRVKP